MTDITPKPFVPGFFHGTKAALHVGDLIAPGFESNFGKRNKAAFVYMAGTLDAAIWGAELALGEGDGRIYVVEPQGAFEIAHLRRTIIACRRGRGTGPPLG